MKRLRQEGELRDSIDRVGKPRSSTTQSTFYINSTRGLGVCSMHPWSITPNTHFCDYCVNSEAPYNNGVCNIPAKLCERRIVKHAMLNKAHYRSSSSNPTEPMAKELWPDGACISLPHANPTHAGYVQSTCLFSWRTHILPPPPALQEVDKLWASVESTRAELAPRKKFSFRSKSKSKSKNNTSNGAEAAEAAAEEVRRGASAAEAEERQSKEDEGTVPRVRKEFRPLA